MTTHCPIAEVTLFNATYHMDGNKINDKEHLRRRWKKGVDNGGSVHNVVQFSFDGAQKVQTVSVTPFEYMLRTWDLPDLAYALRVLGPQNNIVLPNLTQRVFEYAQLLYGKNTGGYGDVVHEMRRWGHHIHQAQTRFWHTSWTISSWPRDTIFAWEALWGNEFDISNPRFIENILCLQSHLPLMDESALQRVHIMIAYEQQVAMQHNVRSGSVVMLLGFDLYAQQHPVYRQIVDTLPDTVRALYDKIVLQCALHEVETPAGVRRKM